MAASYGHMNHFCFLIWGLPLPQARFMNSFLGTLLNKKTFLSDFSNQKKSWFWGSWGQDYPLSSLVVPSTHEGFSEIDFPWRALVSITSLRREVITSITSKNMRCSNSVLASDQNSFIRAIFSWKRATILKFECRLFAYLLVFIPTLRFASTISHAYPRLLWRPIKLKEIHENESRLPLSLSFLLSLRDDEGKKAARISLKLSQFDRIPQYVICLLGFFVFKCVFTTSRKAAGSWGTSCGPGRFSVWERHSLTVMWFSGQKAATGHFLSIFVVFFPIFSIFFPFLSKFPILNRACSLYNLFLKLFYLPERVWLTLCLASSSASLSLIPCLWNAPAILLWESWIRFFLFVWRSAPTSGQGCWTGSAGRQGQRWRVTQWWAPKPAGSNIFSLLKCLKSSLSNNCLWIIFGNIRLHIFLATFPSIHYGSNQGCVPFCFIVLETTKNSLFYQDSLWNSCP